ncbi:MAG: 4Fe-4S dicluster domain-containing protein [Desulfobacterales bacterium]
MKGSSAGLTTLPLYYELLHQTPAGPQRITSPHQVTLWVDGTFERTDELAIAVGDTVSTGQKILPIKGSGAYAISSVAGTVQSIAPQSGDFGKAATAITIQVDPSDVPDTAFAGAEPTLENLRSFLNGAPGNPSFDIFFESGKDIHTIVICGLDVDLLVATNQYVIKTESHAVEKGIEILKSATEIENVVIAVPRDLVQGFGHTGASRLVAVDNDYPAAHPRLILHRIFGIEVPVDRSPEDLGYAFFSAEAVASIGKAFESGRLPVFKTLTLVDKAGRKTMVTARIGTPIREVLKIGKVATEDRDRLIVGGPMRGSAIYSESHPVLADTDAIMVQDHEGLSLFSDYPCINCGECVRACPARIQVNMLVRFLEAGKYENAADEYDLHSCIDCGLCSFVCVARIPIFQYIRLGKFELARMNAAEASYD